jgi:flagellar biosynthesis protein FliR
MTIPATLFSLIKYHSLWYAVNLLAAGGFVGWAGASDAFLSQFHLQGLLAALLIHCLTSLLVGLLYGAMLPMFPRYPIVTAGFMAPLLLTGIIYSALNILSPILNQRIDWFWFILSQLAFGLVCGFVVNLQTKVRTPQFQALPFALRAGLHSDQEELPQSPVNPTDKTAKEDGRP